MELPGLPAEFSGEARKRVIDVEITANRAFTGSKPILRIFPRESTSTPPTQDWQLLHEYILPILLAFAKECCALSHDSNNPWFSDRIYSKVREYLHQLIEAAQYEYRRRSNHRIVGMVAGGEVHADVMREIEQSAEWIAYQDLLLGVGLPSIPPLAPSGCPAIGSQIRKLREEARMTIEDLANEVGLASRNVRRHEAGESQIRRKNIGEYERVFSRRLKRPIVL